MKNSEWVAISERLPDLGEEVLLLDSWETKAGEKSIRVGYLESVTTLKTSSGVSHSYEWGGTEFALNITHWMPLPDLPCDIDNARNDCTRLYDE